MNNFKQEFDTFKLQRQISQVLFIVDETVLTMFIMKDLIGKKRVLM